MEIRKNIPNTITCGNLFCGCLALVKAFEGDLVWTAYLVGIALVLDFLDGFTARLLKVTSAIGKDLDSLADMVTFGVVPGVVMFKLISNSLINCVVEGSPAECPREAYFAFIITIFSCIRLAKFNNDPRQSDSFIGLPTPANTMVICSLPLIMAFQPGLHFMYNAIHNPWSLLLLSCLMSFLLVSEIPLFALKFKNFSWTDNKLVYLFMAGCIVLLLTFHFVAIPLAILLYILVSIVNNIFLKKKL